MMHPLHTERMLTEWKLMDPNYDPRRRTGRTTVLALKLLAEAIENPGVPLRAKDHYPAPWTDGELLCRVRAIVERLEFGGFTFNPRALTVRFG